jgi:hypothetical protein
MLVARHGAAVLEEQMIPLADPRCVALAGLHEVLVDVVAGALLAATSI